jgi:large subunit ribosomal protein L24
MEKIKKNDSVTVIAGKDKGKKGKVLRIDKESSRAIVEGVNLIKRHQKRTKQDTPGGIIQKEAPVHLSNLMLFCGRCSRPSRTGFVVLNDGSKARVCRKCKEVI